MLSWYLLVLFILSEITLFAANLLLQKYLRGQAYIFPITLFLIIQAKSLSLSLCHFLCFCPWLSLSLSFCLSFSLPLQYLALSLTLTLCLSFSSISVPFVISLSLFLLYLSLPFVLYLIVSVFSCLSSCVCFYEKSKFWIWKENQSKLRLVKNVTKQSDTWCKHSTMLKLEIEIKLTLCIAYLSPRCFVSHALSQDEKLL